MQDLVEALFLRARARPFSDWALGCLRSTGRLPTAEEVALRRAILRLLEQNIRAALQEVKKQWKP